MFTELTDLVTGGVESVFVDYPVLLWQLLATVLMVVVVALLMWKPITKFIEKQAEDAEKELNEAKAKNEEADVLKLKLETDYTEMKDEIEKHRKQLLEEAEEEKERILQEAKMEVERKKSELKLELASEIVAQENQIKESIKEIALLAASKILEKKLTSKEDKELVDKIIEEIGGMKSDDDN